jgi:hypothetical protein
MRKNSFFCLFVFSLMISGCGSIYSTYIQSEPLCPPGSSSGIKENDEFCDELSFNGITIKIYVANTTKTSETAFVNDMIPIPVRLKDEVPQEKYFSVSIEMCPNESGFFFYLQKVLLVADQQKYTLIDADFFWGFEFLPEKKKELMDGVSLVIPEKNKEYHVRLWFNGTAPSPKRNISLDLSEALVHDQLPKISVIKFKGRTSSHWAT